MAPRAAAFLAVWAALALWAAPVSADAPAPTSAPAAIEEPNVAVRWEKMFQRDALGFTDFPLGEGARIILVSSSDGSDFNDGLLAPVRTLKKALSLARNDSPDRILFKRGDTFRTANINANVQYQGRSVLEPMIFGAYGDIHQPRPVLESMLSLGGRVAPRFLVVQDLDFYADSRDPSLPSYDFSKINRQQMVGIRLVNRGSYLWIEDCRLRDFGMGMVLQAQESAMFQGLVLRRCQILDSWDLAHSSGIYVENFQDVLIEENLFDHNGWNDREPRGAKTIFNHNMYLQHGELAEDRHFIVRDNISARASSHGCQLRPGGRLENNLFLKNPLAAFVSFSSSVVRNNVVLDADSIGAQSRGVGLQVLNCPMALVEGNIVAHKPDKANTDSALAYDPIVRDQPPAPSRAEVRGNVVYDWAGPAFETHTVSAGLKVHDNFFSQDAFPLIQLEKLQPDYLFENNYYSSDLPSPFSLDGRTMDLQTWCRRSGDSPSPRAMRLADPSRDISSYAASIGLADASLDGFLAAARQQCRGHWDPRLTAPAVNDYIRAGFALEPLRPDQRP